MIPKNLIPLLFVLILISCQTKRYNYINYYNRVNEADSILRLNNDSLIAIKLYKKIFKKYPPRQSLWINEFETYIKLSDKYHKDFGGKKSLYQLIPLVAPNWKYNKQDPELFALYKKYGIDSLEVEKEVANWKKGLNKTLVDSFSIAIFRDQEKGRIGVSRKNDDKNAQLLIWTFNKYGYPSLQKIGLWGNNGIFMPSGLILHHMAGSGQYSYFKEKVLEYVKSGDCPPDDYVSMVERNNNLNHRESEFGFESMFGLKPLNNIIDTIKVNKNRKKIGLPSLKHWEKLRSDFSKNKILRKNTNFINR
jgi:hypothetical protein